MFRILLSTIIIVMMAMPVMAESVVLDAPQEIASPTVSKMEWVVDDLDSEKKMIRVKYRWIQDNGLYVPIGKKGWNYWICKNIETRGENALCVGEGDPWECCTGVGTGDCDGYDSECFSDIFGFQIREQDVGTSIGVGLRTLIWNRFKQDVLPTNNGSFE